MVHPLDTSNDAIWKVRGCALGRWDRCYPSMSRDGDRITLTPSANDRRYLAGILGGLLMSAVIALWLIFAMPQSFFDWAFLTAAAGFGLFMVLSDLQRRRYRWQIEIAPASVVTVREGTPSAWRETLSSTLQWHLRSTELRAGRGVSRGYGLLGITPARDRAVWLALDTDVHALSAFGQSLGLAIANSPDRKVINAP